MIRPRLRILVVFSLLILACGLPTGLVGQSQPTATVAVSETPGALPQAPADTPTASAPATQAPFCLAGRTPTTGPAGCALPTGNQLSQFCTNKNPYTLISVPQGATYDAVTAGFTCSDAGTKNGMQLISCTGSSASSFSVQVCTTACTAAGPTPTPLPSDVCPQGYSYSGDQQCCQANQTSQNGCVTLSFNTIACGTVDCSRIKAMSMCSANHACRWIPSTSTKPAYCSTK